MLKYILVGLFAYLCGSFSTSVFISKTFYGIDVRKYGSGNAGATNTMRTLGFKKALVVLLGDMIKTVIPILVGQWAGLPNPALFAGSFVLIGHSKPVFYGFKGGKGVACAAALVLLFDWRMVLVLLPIFILAFALTKMISVGTFSVILALQVCVWTLHPDNLVAKIYFAVMGIYIFYLHRENLKRILNGTEKKFVKGAKLLKDEEKR